MSSSLVCLSSTDISIRTKRSKNSINQSRRAGCSLGTCTVHVLAHRLHDLNNKLKIGNAPADKINPFGYGRRRRSVPEKVMTLRQEGSRLQTVWSSSNSQSRLHKLEALLRRTWAHGVGALGDAATEACWPTMKFEKCLRLLPRVLQRILFQAQGLEEQSCLLKAVLGREISKEKRRNSSCWKRVGMQMEKLNKCALDMSKIALHWSGLASGKSITSSLWTNELPSWWTSRWDYSP